MVHLHLYTDRVMLRDVTDDDLPIFFEHQRDPAATGMAQFPARQWDAFLTHWRTKVLGDAATRKKAIVVDGTVAGNVVSWEHDGKRLIGYWIGREHWGKGVATRALSEFLAHEAARPLHAWVAERNVASIRVLEKCGFVPRIEHGRVGDDGVAELLMELRGA